MQLHPPLFDRVLILLKISPFLDTIQWYFQRQAAATTSGEGVSEMTEVWLPPAVMMIHITIHKLW